MVFSCLGAKRLAGQLRSQPVSNRWVFKVSQRLEGSGRRPIERLPILGPNLGVPNHWQQGTCRQAADAGDKRRSRGPAAKRVEDEHDPEQQKQVRFNRSQRCEATGRHRSGSPKVQEAGKPQREQPGDLPHQEQEKCRGKA